MKKTLSILLFLAVPYLSHATADAAELLAVTPVVTGQAVSFEISADIAMTYTYYKIPGQARAVVDIAEADPEKVEPLIVVNKGAVSSISVDKAQISGMIISRLIFNLTTETDISVSATPDRKLLRVVFGDAPAIPAPAPPPVPAPEPAPAATIEPPAPAAPPPAQSAPKTVPEAAVPTAPLPTVAAAAATLATAAILAEAEVPVRIPKLEPVVPAPRPATLSIKEIATGEHFLEIRANQPIADYKATRLSKPGRLVIDMPATKTNQKPKTVPVKKFGIKEARIGASPKNIRIVIDSGKAEFPPYTLTTADEGLRINFK